MNTLLTAPHRPSNESRWADLRDGLRKRREAQLARRTLQRELATFVTPADVSDLLATADLHDGPEVEEIRSILADNLSAYHRRQRLVAA